MLSKMLDNIQDFHLAHLPLKYIDKQSRYEVNKRRKSKQKMHSLSLQYSGAFICCPGEYFMLSKMLDNIQDFHLAHLPLKYNDKQSRQEVNKHRKSKQKTNFLSLQFSGAFICCPGEYLCYQKCQTTFRTFIWHICHSNTMINKVGMR